MSEWTKCICLFCGKTFNKKAAEIKRSPRNFCSKQCSALNKAKENVADFFKRCVVTESCWHWSGNLNSDGYGYLKINGLVKGAHRASYEIAKGKIPVGMEVMHSCDQPSCINPDHLSLGTHEENMRDMAAKGRAYSKLNMEKANEIRQSCERTVVLAEKYSVSVRTIRNVRAGLIWMPLPAPPEGDK